MRESSRWAASTLAVSHAQPLFPCRELLFERLAARGPGALVAPDDVPRAQGVEHVRADLTGIASGRSHGSREIINRELPQRVLPLALAAGDQRADDVVGRAEGDAPG